VRVFSASQYPFQSPLSPVSDTQLEMLGHAVLAPLSFPIIELMSSPRYDIKQIGYLAASQSFTSNTEVILLTNNLIKKARTPPPLCLVSAIPLNRTMLAFVFAGSDYI
jgi:hypothetical protein